MAHVTSEQKETEVLLSPRPTTEDPDQNEEPAFPFKPSVVRQKSSNVNVLSWENLLTMLSNDIKTNFNEKVATHFITTIREDQYDLEAIRDDIDPIEDSYLIEGMAEQFEWKLTEQQRFRNTIQNVINPSVADLTGMKSSVCRQNIASELLVCGFLRNLEEEIDEQQLTISDGESPEPESPETTLSIAHDVAPPDPLKPAHSSSLNLVNLAPPENLNTKQRSLPMIVIPDGVMSLVVQYYQTITVYGVGRNNRGEFGTGGRNNFLKLREIGWCVHCGVCGEYVMP